MKNIYIVWQGNFKSNGDGDFNEQGRFGSLTSAQIFMNEIWNDTNGYTKYSDGYLETLIEERNENYNEYDYPEFVDGRIFKY